MNPLHLLLILRARYKIALFVTFLAIAVAIVVWNLATRQYTAETSVVVDVRSVDPVAAVLLPPTMMPSSVGTQVDIIKSDRVARKVVLMLKLNENPGARTNWLQSTGGKVKLEDWLAARLQRGLTVTPSRDSNLITIAFRGTDPIFVAAVANAYAQAYIEVSIELKVEPARQYARWFGDQSKVLRDNLEKAQARLSEFQQKHGLISTGEAEVHEAAKLSDLSARLTLAQAEAAEARSKQRSGAMESLPEVQQNAVISGLRADIARQEVKLKDANFGTKHPQYIRMEAELAEMKDRLEKETRLVTTGMSSQGSVVRSRETELQTAIDAQKKKLLALKAGRDELAVLVRDVETARRAYEAVNNRLAQTSLESQATQSNITVLTPAIEPLEPSFPKPLQISLLFAAVVGLVLGGVSAFALEMLDHRIRSTNDLAEMLQLPVLGVIQKARTPRRIGFWRRGTALVAR